MIEVSKSCQDVHSANLLVVTVCTHTAVYSYRCIHCCKCYVCTQQCNAMHYEVCAVMVNRPLHTHRCVNHCTRVWVYARVQHATSTLDNHNCDKHVMCYVTYVKVRTDCLRTGFASAIVLGLVRSTIPVTFVTVTVCSAVGNCRAPEGSTLLQSCNMSVFTCSIMHIHND
jgi:hypothetical protein